MEQQDNTYLTRPKQKNPAAWTILAVFVAVSLFTSGWLFGSDRISLRSDGIVPVVETSNQVPTDGLNELYSKLVTNYDGDLTEQELLEGLKEGLADAAGDPFTEYLSAEDTESFNDDLDGKFEGIGAELGKEGSFVIVVAPLKGAPAEAAGIQPQDIIIEIDGEDATDISITEAVNRIRGPKGETVTLTLVREGERVETSIVRDTITIESVEWELLEDSIGLITISRFGSDTVGLTQQAARELRDQGADKIVLDMRGNPGGLLDAAVGVSGVWLPQGTTVLEEKQDGKVVQSYKASGGALLEGISTVVLVNKGSASASEIVAGALQDTGAATVLGEQSFGKGSVQRLIPLSSGGSLKVTIARWFTPNGISIDKEGITPDTVVELTSEDREAERDPQLDAAKEALAR